MSDFQMQSESGGSLLRQATIRTPSLTENLRNEKQELEQRLEQVNAVLVLLEGNAELQNTLDTLAKLGYRLF